MKQLVVRELSLHFGGVAALFNVSLEVNKGEILAVIGPNGAGKTSLLNCINGLYRPSSGRIIFNDCDITRFPPHRRAKLGISRTFQNIELFKRLSVLDNIMLGRHLHMRSGILASGMYWGWAQREEVVHTYKLRPVTKPVAAVFT